MAQLPMKHVTVNKIHVALFETDCPTGDPRQAGRARASYCSECFGNLFEARFWQTENAELSVISFRTLKRRKVCCLLLKVLRTAAEQEYTSLPGTISLTPGRQWEHMMTVQVFHLSNLPLPPPQPHSFSVVGNLFNSNFSHWDWETKHFTLNSGKIISQSIQVWERTGFFWGGVKADKFRANCSELKRTLNLGRTYKYVTACMYIH